MNIVVIYRQIGSLNSLKFLEKVEDFDVVYCDARDLEEIKNVLNAGKVDLVVSGTSEELQEDKRVWEAVKHNGIKLWAYVEQWVNITDRFDEECISLIDEVLVPDIYVKNIIDKMFEIDSNVVGHVSLFSDRSDLRKYDIKRVVFVAEEISVLNSTFYFENEEVDEIKISKMIDNWCSHNGLSCAVRPHPREEVGKYPILELIDFSPTEGDLYLSISSILALELLSKGYIAGYLDVKGIEKFSNIDESFNFVPKLKSFKNYDSFIEEFETLSIDGEFSKYDPSVFVELIRSQQSSD